MAQAVSRPALTAEAWVRSRSVHVRFVVDKVALGQVFFFSEYFGFPLSGSFHHCSTLIFMYVALTRRRNGRSLGTLQQKRMPFWKSGSIGQKITFAFVMLQKG
jgi:hypothetical protein